MMLHRFPRRGPISQSRMDIEASLNDGHATRMAARLARFGHQRTMLSGSFGFGSRARGDFGGEACSNPGRLAALTSPSNGG